MPCGCVVETGLYIVFHVVSVVAPSCFRYCILTHTMIITLIIILSFLLSHCFFSASTTAASQEGVVVEDPVYTRGCWIGLHANEPGTLPDNPFITQAGVEDDFLYHSSGRRFAETPVSRQFFFDWINPRTVNRITGTSPARNVTGGFDEPPVMEPTAALFMDWRRGQPDNHTISEGVAYRDGGERCVQLIPWQEDPLIEEQGSWNDASCELKKPFICQLARLTSRNVLRVTHQASISGGVVEGGVLQLEGMRDNVVSSLTAIRSASVVIAPSARNTVLGDVSLQDGSVLVIRSSLTIRRGSFLGESASPANASLAVTGSIAAAATAYPMQSVVSVPDSSVELRVEEDMSSGEAGSTSADTVVNARVEIVGSISVGPDTRLHFLQVGGADFMLL